MNIVYIEDMYYRAFITCIQADNNNKTRENIQEYHIEGLNQCEIKKSGIKKFQK